MTRSHRHLLPFVLASLAVAPAAGAVELVGGEAVVGQELPLDAGADGVLSSVGAEGTAVLLDFTPRGAGILSTDRADEQPRFRLELGAAADPTLGGRDFAGLADDGPSWLREEGAVVPRLSLGGTVSWSDWSLGGAVERAPLFGDEADLLSATLGYGSFAANLAFGQTGGTEHRHPLDVLTLSADLGGWSWLTLESDMALGTPAADDGEKESIAVGRLGVRLNF